jgi:hypothetical protein
MKSVDVMVARGDELEFSGDIPEWCVPEAWYVVIRRAPSGAWRVCPLTAESRDDALLMWPLAIALFQVMERKERRAAAAWN